MEACLEERIASLVRKFLVRTITPEGTLEFEQVVHKIIRELADDLQTI